MENLSSVDYYRCFAQPALCAYVAEAASLSKLALVWQYMVPAHNFQILH